MSLDRYLAEQDRDRRQLALFHIAARRVTWKRRINRGMGESITHLDATAGSYASMAATFSALSDVLSQNKWNLEDLSLMLSRCTDHRPALVLGTEENVWGSAPQGPFPSTFPDIGLKLILLRPTSRRTVILAAADLRYENERAEWNRHPV